MPKAVTNDSGSNDEVAIIIAAEGKNA